MDCLFSMQLVLMIKIILFSLAFSICYLFKMLKRWKKNKVLIVWLLLPSVQFKGHIPRLTVHVGDCTDFLILYIIVLPPIYQWWTLQINTRLTVVTNNKMKIIIFCNLNCTAILYSLSNYVVFTFFFLFGTVWEDNVSMGWEIRKII